MISCHPQAVIISLRGTATDTELWQRSGLACQGEPINLWAGADADAIPGYFRHRHQYMIWSLDESFKSAGCRCRRHACMLGPCQQLPKPLLPRAARRGGHGTGAAHAAVSAPACGCWAPCRHAESTRAPERGRRRRRHSAASSSVQGPSPVHGCTRRPIRPAGRARIGSGSHPADYKMTAMPIRY
eukprot:SAG31_NODE_11654_length_1010_cov_1.042810_1_plen_185_part_00